jgi:hypothetical protein
MELQPSVGNGSGNKNGEYIEGQKRGRPLLKPRAALFARHFVTRQITPGLQG